MDEDSDLARAIAEYSNPTTSYSALEDYLMQRPVFDRGPREAVSLPQLRRLEAVEPQINTAATFRDLLEEQRTQQETARQTEIDALRDLLREELSTTAEAATSERSDLTKALEGRIGELQRGVDAQTLDLRQAGLDERANLARQIEEGDELVRQAQEAAIGDLTDRQASLVGDLGQRIDSLNTDLSGINDVIDSNFQDLLQRQETSASELSAIQQAAQTATEQELGLLSQRAESTQGDIGSINQQLEALGGTQNEINNLNQQLESLYADVESGNAAQSETIRNETANLISGLEQQIGGLADNLGALPIESIQAQLAAVNDQTSQFQSAVDAATGERDDLAAQIAALRDADLTQADLATLSENIAGQRQADIAAALDPIAAQRQADIAAALDPLAAQRQEAIASAVNPIQEQIETLRGEIPEQLDVDALRQQIQDEILANLPQNQTPPSTVSPGTGGGNFVDNQGPPFTETVDSFGFNAPADLNLSDGQADALGLFDESATGMSQGATQTPRPVSAGPITPEPPPIPPDVALAPEIQSIGNRITVPKEIRDTVRNIKPSPVDPRPIKPLPVDPRPIKPLPTTPIIMPPRERPPVMFPPGDSGPIIANPGRLPLTGEKIEPPQPRVGTMPIKRLPSVTPLPVVDERPIKPLPIFNTMPVKPLPSVKPPKIKLPTFQPRPVKPLPIFNTMPIKPLPSIKPPKIKLPTIQPRPVKPLPEVLRPPKRKLRDPVLRTPRFGR